MFLCMFFLSSDVPMITNQTSFAPTPGIKGSALILLWLLVAVAALRPAAGAAESRGLRGDRRHGVESRHVLGGARAPDRPCTVDRLEQ